MKDKNLRKFEDMDIFPNANKCPNNIFNMWVPFVCDTYNEPYEHHQDGLEAILHLIKVLCGNEANVFNYICKWVGQMLTYPEIKSIIPTFISDEGAGKNTFIRLLMFKTSLRNYKSKTRYMGRFQWLPYGCIFDKFK